MKSKFYILVFISLLLCASGTYAQNEQQVRKPNKVLSKIKIESYTRGWEIYESLEMVDVFYKYSDCSDPKNGFYPEYILFKVVNKTNNKVYAYWNFSTEFGGKKTKKTEDENLVQVFLDPKQSIEGSCENIHENKLGILVRLKNRKSLLTDFTLNGINEFKLD